MIIHRPYWQNLIEKAWEEKNVIWLMGVRRVGKTSLCKSLPNVEYFDCEFPRIREHFVDPEGFFENKKGKRLILDEIHRLDNPSEVLKICADHYPDVKIIATGSSTLGASSKFRDTLTGRKTEIWLTPILLEEMKEFGITDIRHRLHFGGLPPYFIKKEFPEKLFNEWSDAYWAKDIQEIFSVGKRYPFQKFAHLTLAESGGIFDATKYAKRSEVSRPTIANYLDVLEETFVAHVIRPFSTHKPTEIVKAPKVYGFDTGFICFAKEWTTLRQSDLGILWEQCVLNELHGKLMPRRVNYWRDKKGHEIDFVLIAPRSENIVAIECKFSSQNANDVYKNFEEFRKLYPTGSNYVVSNDINTSFSRKHEGLTITFVNSSDLIERLKSDLRAT